MITLGFSGVCVMHMIFKEERINLGNEGKDAFFVGYPHEKKGWKVNDTEIGEIFVSQDVIFHEDVYNLAASESAENSNFGRIEQSMGWLPSAKHEEFGVQQNPHLA